MATRVERANNTVVPDGHVDLKLAEEARQQLANSSLFRRRAGQIGIRSVRGVLTITGQVPSFYYKQMLQTELMRIPGVCEIVNRVEVLATTHPS